MSEITEAIEARQAQITQLRSDVETLQRAAGIMGGKVDATAKASSQPTQRTKPKPQTKPKQKGLTWSAADKKAISRRMKAYWAKRRAQNG